MTQVSLAAYSNRTFTFKIKSPPTSWFLKVRACVEEHYRLPYCFVLRLMLV